MRPSLRPWHAVVVLAIDLLLGGSIAGARSSAPEAAAATAPVEKTSAAAAVVTVYRQKRVVGAALNTSVHVDGREVADLNPGEYLKLQLAPGAHRLWADEEEDAVTVDVEAGQRYFFRMELVRGLWKGHGRLIAVGESAGADELAEWKCKPAEDVRAPEMVVP